MRKLIFLVMLCALFPLKGNDAFGQASRSAEGDIVCPATGTSIEIVPARPGRFSIMLNNIASSAVRVGYLDSGTAALSGTTGWVLQPGQAWADSAPGVLSRRVVCMSTTASTATITFLETRR